MLYIYETSIWIFKDKFKCQQLQSLFTFLQTLMSVQYMVSVTKNVIIREEVTHVYVNLVTVWIPITTHAEQKVTFIVMLTYLQFISTLKLETDEK